MTVSIKHNLIYSLITIRLATYFDPVGSSSGLHYKPVNPLNAELYPICHLLALLGAHHILHVSGVRVNVRKLRTFLGS